MHKNNLLTVVAISLSFVLAFSCMVIPVSQTFKWLRPDLVTLVLIYWVTNMPAHVGVYFAFMVGLMFDLLTGMLLGSMGLSLAVVAFLTMNLRLRLRIYSHWQKYAIIMLLVACAQLIRLWIQLVVGHTPGTAAYWLCSLSSALIWPVLAMFLGGYQRSLRIR